MTAATIFGLAGLLALGKKLIDFAKMLTNWRTERSGIVTQALAWAVFVGLVFLYGASQQAAHQPILPGLSLADLDGWSKLILGLSLGSGAGIVADWLAAKDQHDSQALPPLKFPGTGVGTVHPAEASSEAGGPILPDATVNVRPVLDAGAIDAARSALEDALRPVVQQVLADAVSDVTAPASPPPEPPADAPPAA